MLNILNLSYTSELKRAVLPAISIAFSITSCKRHSQGKFLNKDKLSWRFGEESERAERSN